MYSLNAYIARKATKVTLQEGRSILEALFVLVIPLKGGSMAVEKIRRFLLTEVTAANVSSLEISIPVGFQAFSAKGQPLDETYRVLPWDKRESFLVLTQLNAIAPAFLYDLKEIQPGVYVEKDRMAPYMRD